jgi:hypothetical protein
MGGNTGMGKSEKEGKGMAGMEMGRERGRGRSKGAE